MATLNGTKIKDTFSGLLKTTDNGVLGATSKEITDGAGNGSGVYLGTNGKVGIGTTSPDSKLHIKDSGSTYLHVERNAVGSEGNFYFGAATGSNDIISRGLGTGNKDLSFIIGTSERMRINSSGNVGIGTTSPTSLLDVSSNTKATGGIISVSNTHEGSDWAINDEIGSVKFKITDGSSAEKVRGEVKVIGETGGTYPSLNSMIFSTANGSTLTERMRINSSGNVGIGTTSPTFTSGEGLVVNSSSAATISVQNNSVSEALDFIKSGNDGYIILRDVGNLRMFTSGLERMRINSSGNVGIGTTSPSHILHITGVGRSTQSTWATSSDARVKEDITPIGNALNRLSKLNPVSFKFIDTYKENAETETGFIAQEFKEIYPTAVQEVSETFNKEVTPSVEGKEAVEWIDAPTLENTKDEIKEWMDSKELVYNSGDTKSDLIDKIPLYEQESVEGSEEIVVSEGTTIGDFNILSTSCLLPDLVKGVQEIISENKDLKARIEALENK